MDISPPKSIISKFFIIASSAYDFISAQTEKAKAAPPAKRPRIKRTPPVTEHAPSSRILKRVRFRQTNPFKIIQKQNEILKRRAANVMAYRSRRINMILQ
jgi:hypothetical protein